MSDGLKDAIEIVIIVLIGMGLVIASAFVTHDIDARKYSALQTAVATAEQARTKQVLKDYAAEVQKRAAVTADAASAVAVAQVTIDKGNDEIQRLNTCLRAGTCGLRIRTTTTASNKPATPGVPATGPVDTSAGAGLDQSAQSAYLALRGGIVAVQGQLAKCQAYAASMEGLK